jgi:serine/threonine protein kinase
MEENPTGKKLPFRRINTVGKGGFGKVSLFDNNVGKKLVIKSAWKNDTDLEHQYIVLKYLKHRNICSNYLCVKGKTRHDGRFGIVLNYLQDYTPLLDSKIRHLPVREKIIVANDILRKLLLLHQNHVVHGDIKPSNLLTNPYVLQSRIIDFGGAVFYKKDKKSYRPRQYTRAYFASCRKKKEYTWEEMCDNDFWALGLSLLQLFHVKHRFPQGINARNASRANRFLHRKLKTNITFFRCL